MQLDYQTTHHTLQVTKNSGQKGWTRQLDDRQTDNKSLLYLLFNVLLRMDGVRLRLTDKSDHEQDDKNKHKGTSFYHQF